MANETSEFKYIEIQETNGPTLLPPAFFQAEPVPPVLNIWERVKQRYRIHSGFFKWREVLIFGLIKWVGVLFAFFGSCMSIGYLAYLPPITEHLWAPILMASSIIGAPLLLALFTLLFYIVDKNSKYSFSDLIDNTPYFDETVSPVREDMLYRHTFSLEDRLLCCQTISIEIDNNFKQLFAGFFVAVGTPLPTPLWYKATLRNILKLFGLPFLQKNLNPNNLEGVFFAVCHLDNQQQSSTSLGNERASTQLLKALYPRGLNSENEQALIVALANKFNTVVNENNPQQRSICYREIQLFLTAYLKHLDAYPNQGKVVVAMSAAFLQSDNWLLWSNPLGLPHLDNLKRRYMDKAARNLAEIKVGKPQEKLNEKEFKEEPSTTSTATIGARFLGGSSVDRGNSLPLGTSAGPPFRV